MIQRAAKLARQKGGGSLSLLLLGAGMPARGEAPLPPLSARYDHLTEQQRQKLRAALEAAQQDARLSQSDGCLRTEVRPCFGLGMVAVGMLAWPVRSMWMAAVPHLHKGHALHVVLCSLEFFHAIVAALKALQVREVHIWQSVYREPAPVRDFTSSLNLSLHSPAEIHVARCARVPVSINAAHGG